MNVNGQSTVNDQADESPGGSGDEDPTPTRLGELLKRRSILFALGFEGALAVAALALSLLFGLQPWLAIDFGADAMVLSVLATAPLIVAMLALMQSDPSISLDDLAKRWQRDASFSPTMDRGERGGLVAGWNLAMKRTLTEA